MNEKYRAAGVDIDAGNEFVEAIAPHARSTTRPEVLAGLGGFGALYALPVGRYKEPVLVSSTDGVGTKLLIAQRAGKHDTIGIDLVAMCVNDIIVSGAEPVFFLDYFATGKLTPKVAVDVVAGIARACKEVGCALVGGETAEMPGMYQAGHYDLAGFSVGLVEREDILDGSRVAAGDVLLGLASTGLHSNGYSLVRRVLLEQAGLSLDAHVADLGCTLAEELLKPTRLYVRPVLAALPTLRIHALAHITGGGFLDNIPRVLPDGLEACIRSGSWAVPPIFAMLERLGEIPREEMVRTFNCGVGMVVVVAPADADAACAHFNACGIATTAIGWVQPTAGPAIARMVE